MKRSTPNIQPRPWSSPALFFFNPTTESLLTLLPSLSPPHLSIIVTLPLIHRQLWFLPARSFRQPIYTVAGYIYLLEVWGALPSPPLAPWRVVPVAAGFLSVYPNLFASGAALNLAGSQLCWIRSCAKAKNKKMKTYYFVTVLIVPSSTGVTITDAKLSQTF